jgi:hypothetical protein
VTATGSVMGTAAYISPEQASGLPASPASDIYALGIVLIECLTARHPFPGTALESASARLNQEPDLGDARLAEHRELLGTMTALDPGDRPTAAEVASDLSGDARTLVMTPVDAPTVPLRPSAGTGQPSDLSPGSVMPASGAPPRADSAASLGRRLLVIGVALLAAAVVAVATIVLFTVVIPAAVGSQESPDSNVNYPSVAGDLGTHLTQLQDAVAGTDLEGPVLSATVAAADGDYESASRLLDAVGSLATTALGSGDIDADPAERIDAAIEDAQSDLAKLLKPSGDEDEPDDSPGNSGNGNGNGGGKKN